MLKSYEAIYDHGRLRWLGETPPLRVQRVLVVVETQEAEPPKSSGDDEIDSLLQETAGAWGDHSAQQVDALINEMRERDWGQEADDQDPMSGR
ncbi:MAG: hypothetical protein R3310_07560 [Candidatus Competibacteraceae bacterium]|nr:hypothetical protein [Candidatus Competibacteraceae bacterium]